jgi:hypothetical protein
MSGPPRRWHPLVLVSVALAAWVYWPLLDVYFYADDFVHLADLEDEGVLRFLVTPFSGHNFLVRNLIFLGMYRTVGLREDAYFWTVLATHLLNVALLFSVLRTLTGSARLACFGAALWGTTPVAAGTLGWYSAFGHALTATVSLLVLEPLVRLAAAGALPSTRQACWWCALLLAGTACFGTGIGAAVAFPVAFMALLPAAWSRPSLRAVFVLLPFVTVAFWATLRALSTLLAPWSLPELIQNSLLVERLGALPALWGHLLAFGTAATLLGFLLPAGAYPDAACVVAVAALVGGIALVAWRGDAHERRALLAMVALAAGVYLVIAAGRSGLYAGMVSLADASEQPRYHYLGPVFLVATACLALCQVARLPLLRLVPGWAALTAGLALVIVGRLRSEFVIDDHYPVRQYVLRTLAEIDAAAAARPAGATVYLENGWSPTDLLGPVLPNSLFPGRAAVFLITHPTDLHAGRRMRFIERDPDLIAHVRTQEGRRLAGLLVAPKDVPWTPWEVP